MTASTRKTQADLRSIPERMLNPGWDWHNDRKSLRRGIQRVYLIGAGASASKPYFLPTLKSLAVELCKFLASPARAVLLNSIYECLGVDLQASPGGGGVDFEELMNRLDPSALQYLTHQSLPSPRHSQHFYAYPPARAVNPREVALLGLRQYLLKLCSSLASVTGPYDHLVSSMSERDAIVSFNWDVLPELAFRRQDREFCYWDTPRGAVMLKPHGSINWFALLDREMLAVDTSKNWQVFGESLTYYMLFLRDPLGSRDLGTSSAMVEAALSTTPAIVPPIASKILSVGGQPRDGFVESGHWRAMSRIWLVFRELVQEAEELVVIGYSLPGSDAATIEVLKQFAPHSGSAKRKRALIVDPDPNVLTRYRRLVHPNATLLGSDFNEFDVSLLA